MTSYIAKQEAIDQLGKLIPRIIEEIAENQEDEGPIFFSKIDIKMDSVILCQAGTESNFAYVLPGE